MNPPAAALLLAFAVQGGAVAGAQTPAAHRPSSLISGRWLADTVVGGPPCGEDQVCTDVIGDVRLGYVRTLAGPRVPAVLTARFRYHSRTIDAVDSILFVRRVSGERRLFEAIWLGAMLRGRRICVDRQMIADLDIPLPRSATIRDGAVCFPPSRVPPPL